MKVVFGIAVLLFLWAIGRSVERIESKLDDMNQCGPVEVQVSDE